MHSRRSLDLTIAAIAASCAVFSLARAASAQAPSAAPGDTTALVPAVRQEGRNLGFGAGPLSLRPDYNGCGGVNAPVISAPNEQLVVELTNLQREYYNHLPPFKRESTLDSAARYHSTDLAQDNYFNHDTYDRNAGGGLVFVCAWYTRVQSYYGAYSNLAENIAAGYTSPAAVIAGWMNSNGHKANMLSAATWELGAGYYCCAGTYSRYWTQDFGRKSGRYPLVINREDGTTTSADVQLYLYGSWSEMRLKNDTGAFGPWRTFANHVLWTLNSGNGVHTVSAEMRSGGTTVAASDTITIVSGNPTATPTSLSTGTPISTATPLPSPTGNATATPSSSPLPTNTGTSTPVVTPTNTSVPPTATNTAPPPTATLTSTAVPPTATPTNTPVPPTATNTPVPPTATSTNTLAPPTATATNTPVPPTATNTAVPPTATNTAVPPTATATRTNTPVPPTATATNTPIPPTATNTAVPPTATNTAVPPTATPTRTNTPVPPTATNTAVPPTATNTAMPPTATPTRTNTPVPPTATVTRTNTPVPPTATATNTPVPPTATNTAVPPTATSTATDGPSPTPTPRSHWGAFMVELSPAADGDVRSEEPSANNAAVTALEVSGAGQGLRRSFLRFDVTGLPGAVTAAKLRLFVKDGSVTGGSVQQAIGAWSETELTWLNQPTLSDPVLWTLGTVTTGTYVTLNVTSAITGNGSFTLAITSPSDDAVLYASREADLAQQPRLILTVSSSAAVTRPAQRIVYRME